MPNDNPPAPRQYPGVMISSTFTDLERHRTALIKAIDAHDMKPVAMENDAAKPGIDVLDSSLRMVRDSSAYVGVISHKYGQIPECPKRNPKQLSLTELEFHAARELGRPVLLFIMGPDHEAKPRDIEQDQENRRKLDAFREEAKRLKADSAVHRVYKVFNDLHEFQVAATQSVGDLRRFLDEQSKPSAPALEVITAKSDVTGAKPDPIPTPPEFYAEPPYIGSHAFVGRKAQLDALDDWATAADPRPVLLFEAIGGAGKSMLAWEWTTKHATRLRGDWAGRFWYSFYEKGAVMADFCQRALAYVTGRPLEDFRKRKTAELGELLLHQLKARPWLLILDGLERVLVAYHRFDAAQLADDQAETAGDQIAHRNPCAAIRPEDDDLLRALAAAAPSKLLLTTRLTPRVLLNTSSQPIPGVLRERLPGLRPADAEELLRACGVRGDSQDMQNYLKSHCDCHPLVTGVLAGLVNDYLPDRGNFDAWAADPGHGARLNLADLDLVQKRNHILRAALDALPEKSRQLLSTLALLPEAVDYATLSALNPYLPPEPEKVEEPRKPEDGWGWGSMSADEKRQAQADYAAALERRREYEQALAARQQSWEFLTAPQELAKTVRDLERRGLLQYDAQIRRYDLHPVVRGVAAGGLRQDERERYGQRVVDHFSQQVHNPYEEAETLDDLRDGLHLVRTLLLMGRHQEAFGVYQGDLSRALLFNVEAFAETLSLLSPFFHQGWAALPGALASREGGLLANAAAIALDQMGESEEALAALIASLRANLRDSDLTEVQVTITNIAVTLSGQNRLSEAERCCLLALDIAAQLGIDQDLFVARLYHFLQLAVFGRWAEAEAMWRLLDPMGRDWPRALYRKGWAEDCYAWLRFRKGDLREEHLTHAERLAREGKNRRSIRTLHCLRGKWRLEQSQWALACESLREAVRLAHEARQADTVSETYLALARFHCGQLSEPRHEAERLAQARNAAHGPLAELWLAIGDRERAQEHTLRAYEWAWADGEPYVHRYELNKARALLEQLGAEIPNLPPYDPVAAKKFPWEDEVVAAIEKLRAEKQGEKREGKTRTRGGKGKGRSGRRRGAAES